MQIELSQDDVSVIVSAVSSLRLSLQHIASKSQKEAIPDHLTKRIEELLEVEVKLAPYMESVKEKV